MNKEINLPSPAVLAKKQKESLKNVSLRLKQDTYDIFDVMAKEEGTSASAMMINLLDFYAENYRKERSPDSENLSVKMMESYLDKAVDNLLKLDDETRIIRLENTGIFSDLLLQSEVNDIMELRAAVESRINGEDDSKFPYPVYVVFGDTTDYYGFDYVAVREGEELTFEPIDHIPGEFESDSVGVPAKYWSIGTNILALYQDRAKELKPDSYVFFTEKVAKEIFEAGVKAGSVEEYARLLVEILMKFWRGLNE